jgi:hypothetical protein
MNEEEEEEEEPQHTGNLEEEEELHEGAAALLADPWTRSWKRSSRSLRSALAPLSAIPGAREAAANPLPCCPTQGAPSR